MKYNRIVITYHLFQKPGMLLIQGTLEHVFIFITHFRIKLVRHQGTNYIVQSMEDQIVNPP